MARIFKSRQRSAKKNIILIGFMGCGKSTIGRCLSTEMQREFLDTDIKIQNDMLMTISEIFEKYGEQYFRRLERNLCKLVAIDPPMVVATGGGIIKFRENIDTLKTSGVFVYLKNTPEKIYRNLKTDNTRPLLNVENKEEKIRELMAERMPLYDACADITADVSDLKIEESVDMIINMVKKFEEKEDDPL